MEVYSDTNKCFIHFPKHNITINQDYILINVIINYNKNCPFSKGLFTLQIIWVMKIIIVKYLYKKIYQELLLFFEENGNTVGIVDSINCFAGW